MTEIKPLIKKLIVYALLILLCFLLQTSVFSHLELAGVTPNLVLIPVSFFGFMRGRKEGMILGFFSGLFLDLFFGNWFGLYALIFLYIGFLNGVLRTVFYGDDVKLPLAFIGLSDLFYGCLVYVFLFLFRQRYSFSFYFLNIILPEAVYTIVIAILLYYPLLKINSWFDKKDKRSSHTIA